MNNVYSYISKFKLIWLRRDVFVLLNQGLCFKILGQLLRPGRGAKFCDERVCMSVCSRILKAICPNFTKFSVHVVMAVARSSSDDKCNTLFTSGFVDGIMSAHNR